MDKTLIMVEYVYANVDELFNGMHQTRFMAADRQEIIDKVKGLYQTFNEEFPESQYPSREMKVLNVYKCLTEGLLDECNACALKKIEDDAEQNTEVLDEAGDDDDIDSNDYSFIPGSGKNTKFNYLYRDASNYKVRNEFIIKGHLTEEQAAKIIDCCDGEYFKPHMVGMPEKTFADLGYPENEDDVEFFELGGGNICMCDIFSYTDEDSSGITCEQLVENFVKAQEKNWEE